MKARSVNEYQEFKRGQDTKQALDIGRKRMYVVILDETGGREEMDMEFTYDLSYAESLYKESIDNMPNAKGFLLEITGEGAFRFLDEEVYNSYYDHTSGIKILKSTEK